jgi:hypothetical protein
MSSDHLEPDRVARMLGAAAGTWPGQGIYVVLRESGLAVHASDGKLLGLIDTDRAGEVAWPVQYRAVIVPTSSPPRSVAMPTGYVPEWPARTADAERIRWKFVPGVVAPATMRPGWAGDAMTTPTGAKSYGWCWTCDRNVGPDRRTHRDDNPVLVHERCILCNDLLMSTPRPVDRPTGEAALLARGWCRTPAQASEEWARIVAVIGLSR